MAGEMGRAEAEQHLRELAGRAEDIIGTHIRGITFGQDDLRKLVSAVHALVGKAAGEGPSA